MTLIEIIETKMPEIKKLRNELSQNAELSFKEYNTQKIILNFLGQLDLKTSVLFDTGVSALLNQDNECIALRADMDALPVNDVSHACGHDYHMAVLLGTALVLKELGCKKCIKFIFQPGEEDEGGAFHMIEEGVLENPKVKEIIGFHVWPGLEVGKISISKGPSMASVDDFHIKFKGIGGHAAIPSEFKNPIYPAVDFIQKIKTEAENHIITVACINSGSAPNVVSPEAIVKGTVRTFDAGLRKELRKKIVSLSESIAAAYGCEAKVYYSWQFPPLINDENVTEKFIHESKIILGSDNVIPLIKTFAAEDFSFFAEKIPAVHFRLGIAEKEKGLAPLHSPSFSASDQSLFYGIYIITNYILNS